MPRFNEKRGKNVKFILGGGETKQKRSEVYLGAEATAKTITDRKSIERTKNGRQRLQALQNDGVHTKNLSGDTILRLVKTFIHSTAMHTILLAPLTAQILQEWNKLEKQILMKVLGTFSERPRHRLRKIAKLPTLPQRMGKRLRALEARLSHRARSLNNDNQAQKDQGRHKIACPTLGSVRNTTEQEIEKGWIKEEKKKTRQIPMGTNVIPALELNDKEIRKAVKKYYLGTLRWRERDASGQIIPTESTEMEVLRKTMYEAKWTEDEKQDAITALKTILREDYRMKNAEKQTSRHCLQ